MYITKKPLVLASSSPRRKEYFDMLGFEYNIEVMPVDETVFVGETAEDFVLRMAYEKAVGISGKYPERWVVGADTVVCFLGSILGKPRDSINATQMLCGLAGNTHVVMTGFSLMCQDAQISEGHVVATRVFFSPFDEDHAKAYVATGEPLDKAGSYGIQGLGGAFVEKIEGSYSNVVGLPVAELVSRLEYHAVVGLASASGVLKV